MPRKHILPGDEQIAYLVINSLSFFLQGVCKWYIELINYKYDSKKTIFFLKKYKNCSTYTYVYTCICAGYVYTHPANINLLKVKIR